MIVDRKSNKPILGAYLIDGNNEGTKLATTIKPKWLRRKLIELLLGWIWLSIKELK